MAFNLRLIFCEIFLFQSLPLPSLSLSLSLSRVISLIDDIGLIYVMICKGTYPQRCAHACLEELQRTVREFSLIPLIFSIVHC